MIVNHQYRFVFLPIPKTAGTSISAALQSKGKPYILGPTRHRVAAELIPPEYFVFTFVRNPFDRLLSYYSFRHGEPRTAHRYSIHPDERKIGFTEWLERLDEFASWPRINREFNLAIKPQWEIVGRIPHFVGKYESLQRDFDHICQRIDMPASEVPLLNKTTTKNKHYAEVIDKPARALIESRYGIDLETYGYEF